MTTPPAVCPACGAAISRTTTAEVFFQCGAYYVVIDIDNPGVGWLRVTSWECRNAFDAAVKLREENARLMIENTGLNDSLVLSLADEIDRQLSGSAGQR